MVTYAILTVFNFSFVFHLTERGQKYVFINTHAIKATFSFSDLTIFKLDFRKQILLAFLKNNLH